VEKIKDIRRRGYCGLIFLQDIKLSSFVRTKKLYWIKEKNWIYTHIVFVTRYILRGKKIVFITFFF